MTSAVFGAAAAEPLGETPTPLVRVRDLGIRHDGATHAAPAAATFDVARGEVVLLLGPSGAGKSTLALALDGLIPHAVPATLEGSVLIDGLDTAVTPVAELSTRVAMAPQSPTRSGEANITSMRPSSGSASGANAIWPCTLPTLATRATAGVRRMGEPPSRVTVARNGGLFSVVSAAIT